MYTFPTQKQNQDLPATPCACGCSAEDHGEELLNKVYLASVSKLVNVLWYTPDFVHAYHNLRNYTGMLSLFWRAIFCLCIFYSAKYYILWSDVLIIGRFGHFLFMVYMLRSIISYWQMRAYLFVCVYSILQVLIV